MLSTKVRVIFLIIGLASSKQCQAIENVNELEESFIGQSKNITQEVNFTDVNVPLIYCCPGGKGYRPFVDTCLYWDPNDNSTEPQLDNLPIYSTHNNQIIQPSPQIEITDSGFTDCPNGYFGNSTRDFKLLGDGSLRIGEKRLEPKSFCINQIHSPDENNLIHVARYCDPDPCSVNGAKCIRKCCPQGMAINGETNTCEPNPIPFDVPAELHDENNNPINLENFTLYGGLGVKCLSLGVGITKVYPEEFIILSDGRMKSFDYPCKAWEFDERTTDNYCVENLFIDGEREFIGARCNPPFVDDTDPEGLSFYPYLFLFSSVFVVTTFLVYAILPKLRNIFGVVVMCYLASMTVFYIGLATIQLYKDMPEGVCVTLPVLVHYSSLATFSWLNVVCFDLWRVFGMELRSNSRSLKNDTRLGRSFIFYSIYGWGLPLVIVSIGQILQNVEDSSLECSVITPNFGMPACWFHYRSSSIAYLNGPMGIMIVVNIIMFVWASIKFNLSSLETKQATGNTRVFQRFRVILSLFLVTGTTWLTELIWLTTNGTFKQYVVTDSINILNGLFVFIVFICKPNVWQMLKEKFQCLPASSAWHRYFTRFVPKNDAPRLSITSIGSSNGLVSVVTMDTDIDGTL